MSELFKAGGILIGCQCFDRSSTGKKNGVKVIAKILSHFYYTCSKGSAIILHLEWFLKLYCYCIYRPRCEWTFNTACYHIQEICLRNTSHHLLYEGKKAISANTDTCKIYLTIIIIIHWGCCSHYGLIKLIFIEHSQLIKQVNWTESNFPQMAHGWSSSKSVGRLEAGGTTIIWIMSRGKCSCLQLAVNLHYGIRGCLFNLLEKWEQN